MADSGYIYILQSESGDHQYIGSCLDPDRRLAEHMSGHVKATAGKGPWRRVGLLQFPTATLARKAEHWLKRLRRREYTEMILAGTFEWPERFGAVIPSRRV
ncbi:MAG: GIY-YIG nuclease family protein [Lentisphaerae bacterium]|nr:GIY-YIG nuclease family protein [Lentisphaerota bacterium]